MPQDFKDITSVYHHLEKRQESLDKYQGISASPLLLSFFLFFFFNFILFLNFT